MQKVLEYKLKLIDKKQETSENEILIAMQKDMIIKYHYYEIYINNQKVESVDRLEEAQTITNKIKNPFLRHKESLRNHFRERKTV